MDTDFLYLALAEEYLDGYIHPSKRAEWIEKQSKDCRDDLRADTKNNSPLTCCAKQRKHDKREPGLLKEEFRFTEMLFMSSKIDCYYDSKSQKHKFSSKGLNKHASEGSGDGPISKYRQVLDDAENLISKIGGFKTINHVVATYEQTIEGLSYFLL